MIVFRRGVYIGTEFHEMKLLEEKKGKGGVEFSKYAETSFRLNWQINLASFAYREYKPFLSLHNSVKLSESMWLKTDLRFVVFSLHFCLDLHSASWGGGNYQSNLGTHPWRHVWQVSGLGKNSFCHALSLSFALLKSSSLRCQGDMVVRMRTVTATPRASNPKHLQSQS